MKKLLFLFLFLILTTANIFAQIKKQLPPVMINPQGSNPKDTIIKIDSNDNDRQYITIKNINSVTVALGEKYKGLKDGIWREYYNNGTVSKIEQYKHGQRNGFSLSFSFIGQLQMDENYFNDSLDGLKTTYMSNGRIKTSENYLKGQLSGEYKSYYEDSKLKEESYYMGGKRDSISYWYFQNGKPSAAYNYKNGNLEGQAIEYNEDGTLKTEGQYVNNDEEGEWKEYTQGEPAKLIIYKNGKVVKEKIVKKESKIQK